MKARPSTFHLSKWRSKSDEERRGRKSEAGGRDEEAASVRASHVVAAAKDIVAATSAPSVRSVRPPPSASSVLRSRFLSIQEFFVESRVSEKEERGRRSLGSVAMRDECESTQPGLALSNPHFIRAFLIVCVIPDLIPSPSSVPPLSLSCHPSAGSP